MAQVHNSSVSNIVPPRDECLYTKCYCEENVWKLCDHIQQHSTDELQRVYAVFISNQDRVIPLWKQKAARQPGQPVLWDYHVILLYNQPAGSDIYDLDTVLPFPVSFREYVERTIGSNERLKEQFHRFFRVVPAASFLKMFASDRSHMRKENGEWQSPPPTYPCIVAQDGTQMNLDSYISMELGTGPGEVMTLQQFWSKFSASVG
ncbi:protein N-terminal glutamine amidohydrolase-like [Diadema setosum]|uniref:protein N-terminal glutamine amidohydrolase-like n=1 Tax=Diadema setosum TaxID=31175 RepID=UPI003B3B9B4E